MNLLKRLFGRKRSKVVVTGIAGELIRPGQFFIIVEGKAYPVSPQRLTQPPAPKPVPSEHNPSSTVIHEYSDPHEAGGF